MKDYIIVGGGLAGISFVETAYTNGKSFIVVSDSSQNSSLVAAGIYNPVILKRLRLNQNAAEHVECMEPFYKRIEKRLGVKFDFEIPVYRKFASVEEQNDWFNAADKPVLGHFLSTSLIHTQYEYLPAPFGFGKVLHTGYMDTSILINAYHDFLTISGSLLNETFDHDALDIHTDHNIYKGMEARHIIFAEGFGMRSNPYFSHLPLEGTKGEILVIRAPLLQLDAIVNAGVFILPMGNDIYKVGATYEWHDKTDIPTEKARNELIERLNDVITCDYEIISQLAGVRPTTKDRKALVGTHPEFKNVHLLNGLGTRGVILGPAMAKELYNSIEMGIPVPHEINLERFSRKIMQ
ncbi:FAD-dependent oxidoreductase [Flavobacterium album]|uniref:FAD-dependent oxidoreductase n=1 Tax=Flavobacterium album TaxID=2175091 RepID=A0A2S1QXW3_9FLAO|nr:FAD-dependent oxidoreductase [Flavobacterium album]AWH85081.1 FAD-dependent oxidoreductase [Flavobacterium album]